MSRLYIDDCPQGALHYGKQVMLATPAYDSTDASYTFSLSSSRSALHDEGIGTTYLLLSGDCHVDDARNMIVREFLASSCTDLVFIDADVAWDAKALVQLCQYEIEPLDVVGGVYPFRQDGCPDMPVLSFQDHASSEGDLVEVQGLPTGFMRIRRPVLDRMAASAPHFRNKRGVSIPLIFERMIKDGLRYGGDINFCLKAREQGGRCFAASDIRLGHVSKSVRWGSYASGRRAQSGDTLRYVVERIQHGGFTPDLLEEVIDADGNIWAAPYELLAVAIGLARQAELPILELGSGLSTVLMAAATGEVVHALEHSVSFAWRTQEMAEAAGVENIAIHITPLVNGFYKVPERIPTEFSFLLVDGPPRALGDRRLFTSLPVVPDTILFDDADSYGFKLWAEDFARDTGRDITVFPSSRTMLMRGAKTCDNAYRHCG